MQAATKQHDVYARVTDRIIADLEQGTRPWLKPWSSAHVADRVALPLRHNGTPYRGVNVLLLWGAAADKGYASARWMTFGQAQKLGAHVRKGEQGTLVVYADTVTRTAAVENGEEIERQVSFMKGYTVFNADQIDGLAQGDQGTPPGANDKPALIEAAETFFAATGATFRHGGDRAYYSRGLDVIHLPPPAAFIDAESYAATKAHELTHWTAHPSRLNRMLGKRFGDEAYAAEELVAELGAAFLCVALGITPEPRADHASYLAHWLKVLKADKRAIFTAAGHAQRATDFLHQLQIA